jgi:mono/diheme cytochrome c family protein
MLWNPIITTSVLPGEFIPAAKVMHGLEAVLAVLAILLWHFYGVHLKSWNWSMIKGTLSAKEMEEEHAAEIEEIARGEVGPRNSPAEQKKRMRIFAPVASVATLIFLVLVYGFVFAETSSLTTVPPMPAQVTAFVRQTTTPIPTATITPTRPPTATPLPGATATPAGALTWATGIGDLFTTNCVACHGTLGELSLATYADAMKGGKSGPAIVIGDPDGSLLIQTMATAHAKVLEAVDLQKVIAWIKAGALEK